MNKKLVAIVASRNQTWMMPRNALAKVPNFIWIRLWSNLCPRALSKTTDQSATNPWRTTAWCNTNRGRPAKIEVEKPNYFYWSMVDLQYHNSFRYTTQWFNIFIDYTPFKVITGTSLVAQWLGIHLTVQGTQVRALVLEDPTCHGATGPMCHSCWACALEPASHNYGSMRAWRPCSATGEAAAVRGPCTKRRVAPTCCTWGGPACSSEDPTQPKINK